LAEDSKDEKNLLAGLNLHYVDAMALNDDEKGLTIEFFFGFSSRRFAWNPELQSLSFSEEIIRRSENYFRRRFISSSEADGRFSFF
jgi:hypothetical protein